MASDRVPTNRIVEDSVSERRELYPGLIRMHVLHHACEEPILGLAMIEELARHSYKLSPGTLYLLLGGMEKQGLLRHCASRRTGNFGGCIAQRRRAAQLCVAQKARERALWRAFRG